MSIPDNSVVFGRSIQANAPAMINGTAGSLITLLKALLVDGWAETPLLSMSYNGTSGLVEALFAEEHDFEEGQVIEITGANETEYNGRWKIEARTSHEIQFAISNVPSGDATGDLYIRVAPAGWSVSHESGDGLKAIFTTGNGESHLYVDEEDAGGIRTTNNDAALAYFVDNVVDIDTHDRVCGDNDVGISKGAGVTASGFTAIAEGNSIPWCLFADSSAFYLGLNYVDGTDKGYAWVWFFYGEIVSYGDTKLAVQMHSVSKPNYGGAMYGGTNLINHRLYTDVNNNYVLDIPRVDKVGEQLNEAFRTATAAGSVMFSGSPFSISTTYQTVNPVEYPTQNGELLIDDRVQIYANNRLCGHYPGYAATSHDKPISHWSTVDANGRLLKSAYCMPGYSTSSAVGANYTGVFFIDLTGPWR